MRLLVATDPDHGKPTKMLYVCTRALCDVIISTREYGPLLHVGGEILQLTHEEDRNNGGVRFASVCHANGVVVVGYVP